MKNFVDIPDQSTAGNNLVDHLQSFQSGFEQKGNQNKMLKICHYFDENFDKPLNKNDTFPRAHFFARRARGIQRG